MSVQKRSILVVDESPDNLDALLDLFADTYHVKTANSAEHALTLLSKQPLPDLILIDIMMPLMSGFDLCEQLKANPITHSVPVVFISSSTEQAIFEKGIILGAAGFLSKPIVQETLHATIETALAY